MTQASRALVAVQNAPSDDHENIGVRRRQHDDIHEVLEALKPEIEKKMKALELRQHLFDMPFNGHIGDEVFTVARTNDILRAWFWSVYRGNPQFLEYGQNKVGIWTIRLYK
ncbi:MAG: hypothetical protein WAZ27_01260 [Minisyncoccia bacterium]